MPEPSPFTLSYTTCTTSELRAFYTARTALPSRRRSKALLDRLLARLDATATFPLFALPAELRLHVYAALLAVAPSPRNGGRAEAFPQILRVCKTVRREAQALLWEVNTATVDVRGSVSSLNGWFPGLGLEEVFKTEVVFSVAGAARRRVVLGARRGEAGDLLDVEARVPDYVRRMRNVRLVVGVVDGVKEAAGGRPVPELRIESRTPFAGVSQVVFAVASAAGACWRLEVGLVARLPGVDHVRLLTGVMAFRNVRVCEVDLLGVGQERCAAMREAILAPRGVRPVLMDIFDIVRDTKRVSRLVRVGNGPPNRFEEMLDDDYLHHFYYAEDMLSDLRFRLRDPGYMPFLDSPALWDALKYLRVFLEMGQTQCLLI